tara:strand:+ start:788 stop:1051 length:264 start_codon:yes stop_codon:yes gene_type:complete
MKKYIVQVTLTQESHFDVEIDADDYEQAEKLAKDGVWEDNYTDEIRWSLEITDEHYECNVVECEDCLETYDVFEDECPECLEGKENE